MLREIMNMNKKNAEKWSFIRLILWLCPIPFCVLNFTYIGLFIYPFYLAFVIISEYKFRYYIKQSGYEKVVMFEDYTGGELELFGYMIVIVAYFFIFFATVCWFWFLLQNLW